MSKTDFKVEVEKPNTLIFRYYPDTEATKDNMEIRIKFPKEYQSLLEDANFIESIQALMLHMISTLELQMNENEFLDELIQIASLREVLYEKSLEVIQNAVKKYLGSSLHNVTSPRQRYNNFILEIL